MEIVNKIENYLRGFYLLVIYSIFLFFHRKILHRLDQNNWNLNSSVSWLEGFNMPSISMILFFTSILCGCLLIFKPLNRYCKAILFIAVSLLLALGDSPGKVDHNSHFIIYPLFLSNLVYFNNKINLVKNIYRMKTSVLFMASSIFIPFFLSGLSKIEIIFSKIMVGEFSENYLRTDVLTNQVLAEVVVNKNINIFVKFLIANESIFFPLFYLGIIFQISSFFIALLAPKRMYELGVLCILFFFMTGFVVNALFESALLMILYCTFAFPFTNYKFKLSKTN